ALELCAIPLDLRVEEGFEIGALVRAGLEIDDPADPGLDERPVELEALEVAAALDDELDLGRGLGMRAEDPPPDLVLDDPMQRRHDRIDAAARGIPVEPEQLELPPDLVPLRVERRAVERVETLVRDPLEP